MVMGLNPYSNGIRIEQYNTGKKTEQEFSLNPYSNGIRIEPEKRPSRNLPTSVLILILMEYG